MFLLPSFFFFKFYRASHLRRIRLVGGVSSKGLLEVVNKLPLLEELEISSCDLCKDSVEAIGRYCPLLKSLKYSNIHTPYHITKDKIEDEVFAIGRTMHGLRHLKLSGYVITNVGLVAILDGCPHLESLDLEECFRVDLSGSLGERCHEQIKDLRPPTNYEDVDPYWADHDFYADFDFGFLFDF